jgi:hypothetical protein
MPNAQAENLKSTARQGKNRERNFYHKRNFSLYFKNAVRFTLVTPYI